MSETLFRLDGRVALVTGAASGIGRRVAVGLAEFGADVCLVDLAGSDLDGAADEVVQTGRRVVTAGHPPLRPRIAPLRGAKPDARARTWTRRRRKPPPAPAAPHRW